MTQIDQSISPAQTKQVEAIFAIGAAIAFILCGVVFLTTKPNLASEIMALYLNDRYLPDPPSELAANRALGDAKVVAADDRFVVTYERWGSVSASLEVRPRNDLGVEIYGCRGEWRYNEHLRLEECDWNPAATDEVRAKVQKFLQQQMAKVEAGRKAEAEAKQQAAQEQIRADRARIQQALTGKP